MPTNTIQLHRGDTRLSIAVAAIAFAAIRAGLR
jgi:hypothetical protein